MGGQAFVGTTIKGVPIHHGIINYSDPTPTGTGQLVLPSVKVQLNTASNFKGNIKTFTIASGTTGAGGIPALTDNAMNYIVIDYNSGNPIWNVQSDTTNIANGQVIPYVSAFRLGTAVNFIQWDDLGVGLSDKLADRLTRTERFKWESGLITTTNASLQIQVTDGYSWHGAVRKQHAQINYGDNMVFWKHVTGTWTPSTVTTFNNTQYDDGTDLVLLGSNKWTVNWVYRCEGSVDTVTLVLGNAEYHTYADAVAALEPPRPPAVAALGLLVARIIVQNGSTTSTVLSAFTQPVGSSQVTDHESLSNLLGGDGVNQHYHFANYATVAAAEAATGSAGEVIFIQEQQAWYTYDATLGETRDGDLILNTAAGGATRWVYMRRVARNTGGDTGWVSLNSPVLTVNSTTVIRLAIADSWIAIRGVRHKLAAGNYDVTISGVAGTKFIYFDDFTGVLKVKDSLFNFASDVPVAFCTWDGAAISSKAGTEFHGIRDAVWHAWAHKYFGAQYDSGLTATANTQTDNNTDPNVDTVEYIWFTTGTIYDEDTPITVGTGAWTQTLGSGLTSANAAVLPIYYYNGAGFTRVAPDANRYPFLYTGANGAPEWNSSGTRTAATTGQYVAYHYFASPLTEGDSLFGRPHNAVFASLAAAQAARPSSLVWSGFPVAEVKHIYSVIFRVNTGWSPSPVHGSKIVNLSDYRLTPGSPVAGISGTDHQALSNRDATNAHLAPSVGYTPTTDTNWDISTDPVNVQEGLDKIASQGVVKTQSANTIYSGPSSGGAALPTFRTGVAADITMTGAGLLGRGGAGKALELGFDAVLRTMLPVAIYTSDQVLAATSMIAIGNHATTAIAFDLPALDAASNNVIYYIKNVNNAVVTVSGTSTIDGDGIIYLYRNDSLTIVGSNSLGKWVRL